jgi:TIR domain
MANGTSKPLKLFYAYSHEDLDLLKELDNHLSFIKSSENIETWYDQKVPLNANPEQTIKDKFNAANIIFLLISANFMASEYIVMHQALKKHDQGTALVLPIILRHCDWNHPPLNKLQALPDNRFPVENSSGDSGKNEQFLNIAQGLRKAITTKKVQRRQKDERRKKVLLISAGIGIFILLLSFISGIFFYIQNSQQTSN